MAAQNCGFSGRPQVLLLQRCHSFSVLCQLPTFYLQTSSEQAVAIEYHTLKPQAEHTPALLPLLPVRILPKQLMGLAFASWMGATPPPQCSYGFLGFLQVLPGLSCCPAIALDACRFLTVFDSDT